MAQKTGSAVTGMGKAGKGASGDMGSLTKTVDKFKSSVLPAVGVVVGFGLAVNEAFEFAQEGAQLLRLSAAGDQLAESLGGNMDQIVQSISSASMGMVDDAAIIGAANRAMMLGLGADAGQLGQLMEVAAFRARAMGLTTEQAFNDIVTGVGRMSPLILDNLGIVVDSKTKYDEWAAAHGRAASSLTAVEKKQILLNSVLAEGASQIEAAGGLTLDAAGKFEQFGANVENQTNRLKEFAAGVGEAIVTSLNVILFSGDMIDQALGEQSQRLATSSTSWAEYEAGVIEAAKAAGIVDDGFEGFIDTQGRLIQVLDTGRIQYHELASDQQFLTRETLKATKVTDDFTQAIGFDAPSAVSNYVDAARRGVRANREIAESTGNAIMSMNDLKTVMAGPVGEENERFAEQQADILAEMEKVQDQIIELEQEQGVYAGTTDEITVAQFKAAQAADKLTTAQQQLAENTDTEKQQELEAAVAGAQIAFDKAAGAAANASGVFVDNSEKIGGLQGKYGELAGSLEEAADTHRDRMNSIIFDLVMAELAVGGFTEAEAELASRMAEDMGLIDEETGIAMRGVADAMAGFAQSEGVETALFQLGQVRDTALGIPNNIPVNITVRARIAEGRAIAESVMGGAIPTGANVPGFQTGINVVPRRMLAMLHPGEAVIPREDNPNIPGNSGMRGGGDEFHLHIAQSAAVDLGQMRSAFNFLQNMG